MHVLAQITCHDHANYHIKGKAIPLISNRHRAKVEEHLYPQSTLALDRVGGPHHAPDALPPRKKTFYPGYRRLRGPRGQSGWYGKSRTTWVRTPDPATYSKSLYRQCCPSPSITIQTYTGEIVITVSHIEEGYENLNPFALTWHRIYYS